VSRLLAAGVVIVTLAAAVAAYIIVVLQRAETALSRIGQKVSEQSQRVGQLQSQITKLTNDLQSALSAGRASVERAMGVVREGQAPITKSRSRVQPRDERVYDFSIGGEQLEPAIKTIILDPATLVEQYCSRASSQEQLLRGAERLGLSWGAVDVNHQPPRLGGPEMADVLAIAKARDSTEMFVVLSEDCVYSFGIGFFFKRVSTQTQIGERVFSKDPGEVLVHPDRTLEVTAQGNLEVIG
jgi:hypothetical protein